MKNAAFDRLAVPYRALEWLAFQGDLERARFCHLEQLRECHDILMLGEGDGRALARLAAIAPQARIHYVDASGGMLAVASGRIAPADRVRITFQQADATALVFPRAAYDAVTTLFFLDCFTATQVTPLVQKIEQALRPEAWWCFADFALPARGWRRWRARVWVACLYAFFRWQTRIAANCLPPSEAIIRANGFAPERTREFQSGLLRSALFRRDSSTL
jgi:ubiquinone/menaquinone biosynthesis C-methylase UbiE